MYLSREQVRTLDRRAIEEFGVPGVILMENAGRGTADVLISLGCRGPVTICCGKGNNGGDGLVIARHLDNRGIPIRALLFGQPDQLTGDAAVNYQIVTRSGIPTSVFDGDDIDTSELQAQFAKSEWIVDALFGTGLSGPVRKPFDQVIQFMNESKVRILAADIPSGLDCDTGLALGPTVRAEHTVTFVAEKKGFANPEAKPWIGQVHAVDIGVPRRLLNDLLSARARS
jgi:NAD(P)H-hydrate epimerase